MAPESSVETRQRKNKNPKLVADVLALAQGQILLVRYKDVKNYDGQKGWFLPDDYLAFGEHPSDAARRILREQAGLDVSDISLIYIESLGGRHGDAWHLIFHHKVELDKISTVVASGNVKDAEWFLLDSLPDRESIAHSGWALDVIAEIFR